MLNEKELKVMLLNAKSRCVKSLRQGNDENYRVNCRVRKMLEKILEKENE